MLSAVILPLRGSSSDGMFSIRIVKSVLAKRKGLPDAYAQLYRAPLIHTHVYPCGRQASALLKSLVDGKLVICVEEGRDRYDRFVATCFAGGRDLGMAIVAAGWAVANKRITGRYNSAQETAKAAKKGMWASAFVEPAK